MSNLFVGAGRSLMNPEQDMYPMPTGFGMADDIYDSCHCRAIAVKSGGVSASDKMQENAEEKM